VAVSQPSSIPTPLPIAAESTRWCLRGRVGTDERRFPLAGGENLIGSAEGNTVRLAQRGVSRHHASLRLEESTAVVLDLGSKNGVRVNGRAVQRAGVTLGDEVTFGPVTLRLEEIAAADVELGLPLGGPSADRRRWDPGVTSQLADREGAPRAWVELLADLAARTAMPLSDPPAALATLMRRLGVSGVALVEWRPPAEPVIEGVAGRLGELPREIGAATAGASRLRLLALADGSPCTVWVEGVGHGGGAGLVLWGDYAGRADSAPLLATACALLRRVRGEPLADLAPRGERDRAGLAFPIDYLPCESPAMQALYRQMEALAGADLPVLILGETGSGKEPIARTVHASSPRRGGPFVAINCAAIPADLLEAELFGIGKNVATGVAGRSGRLAEAAGGTVFLDEIGDMPLSLQAKLLRVLQEKVVQPVGAPAAAIDVRVVAATNRDLRQRTSEGAFRSDLYYRLAGLVLAVPPLRARREDVPLLVGHFLGAACREAGKSLRGVTVKALHRLVEYGWPGNVRELEHEMRRIAYLCPAGGAIDSLMLPDHVLAPAAGDADDAAVPSSLVLQHHTDALERRLIRLALARSQGNQSRAAELLGISRNGLANRLRRLGLDAAGGGVE
jgi:DNA-binding NtrC family response regulator